MSDWRSATLGELVDVLDAQRRPVNSEERSVRIGDVPYYGANGQQGWIDEPLFDEPLILMAEDGGNFDDFHTRPIAYRIDGPSWVNNYAHIIRSKRGVYQPFLFWSLVHRDIRRYISGGTRTKLTQAEMRAIELKVPDLIKQRRIAEILDTLDDQIRLTNGIISKLEAVGHGLLTNLLSRGVDVAGRLRKIGSFETRVGDSGSFPAKWNVVRLDQIADVERGKFGHRPRNDPTYLTGPFPFIQTGDVAAANGRTIQDASQSLSRLGAAVSREFATGTIAVTIAANIADTAMLGLPMYFPDSVVGVSARSPNVSEYVEYVIRKAKPRLEARAPQSAQRNINLQDLRPLEVPLPDPAEQTRIVQIMKAQAETVAIERRVVDKLARQKAALLDDLLTGRVRVPTEAVS